MLSRLDMPPLADKSFQKAASLKVLPIIYWSTFWKFAWEYWNSWTVFQLPSNEMTTGLFSGASVFRTSTSSLMGSSTIGVCSSSSSFRIEARLMISNIKPQRVTTANRVVWSLFFLISCLFGGGVARYFAYPLLVNDGLPWCWQEIAQDDSSYSSYGLIEGSDLDRVLLDAMLWATEFPSLCGKVVSVIISFSSL